ncbi:HRDC domain protein [Desulfosarcina cetonica]|uniref:HRDC domain-containing protein n=1 Tax=Desulfosarcina cetonica TaxID=90730 RepID=UPI0006CF381A|nr:HRDC domain-containing protein [Desulfosarcina cetonica]VTR70773.1 HRDC domain protein [Desulfosarcina cetonica]
MKYAFFSIPARHPDDSQQSLNTFCSGCQVLNVEKEFVADGERSFWSVCVTWIDGDGDKKNLPKSRIDYKEILNEQDFAVFAKLRSLRKSIADKEGLPLYALFSNEQLAVMVQQRVTTQSALAAIDGVGKARIGKYGQEFLALLRNEYDSSPSVGEGNVN